VSDDVLLRKRTAPDSKIPNTNLTDDEKLVKLERLKRNRQNLMKKIVYAKVSSAKKMIRKEDLPFSDLAENWQRPLEDAMAWFRKQSTTTQDGLKKELVISILEATCNFSNGNGKWNKEESEEFAQFMLDEIQNKARAMSGKKTTVRFSQGTLRTSLTLYLRSQVGYEEFKENSPQCLPSIRTLRNLQSKMRVDVGYNPTIYPLMRQSTVIPEILPEILRQYVDT
jgi:hypothetical protein